MKPINTTTSPIRECSVVVSVKTPAKARPVASGIDPARNKKPVAPMNSSFDTFCVSKYIATGGDQIELRPPRVPENSPTATCQLRPGPIGMWAPNIWVSEKIIIAKPIEIVRVAVGKERINNDVKKMLDMMATPKSQYLAAIIRGDLQLAYCMQLVKMIGRVSRDMAMVGSITSVNIAIAAAGRPMPKKPLITPAKKNTTKIKVITPISSDGSKKARKSNSTDEFMEPHSLYLTRGSLW